MPMPDFQSLMLPLLELARDGQVHRVAEAIAALAAQFKLSQAELDQRLPSGTQATFSNRVNWACTHLKQARLLESAGRGQFRMTDRGREVLGEGLSRIDLRYLLRFPEFVEFRQRSRPHSDESSRTESADESSTPQERIEAAFGELKRSLAEEVLLAVRQCSPEFFERLVVHLLVEMGYGGSVRDAGQAVGRSGDGGIDGIIKEDALGLDAVYLQAKRWDNTIGRPEVQRFAGSLEGFRARKGVLITTSSFSKDAFDYVARIEKKIVLIDGQTLAELMIEHGVGVTEVERYAIKRLDRDYFGDEA